jgi:hypothetical protein
MLHAERCAAGARRLARYVLAYAVCRSSSVEVWPRIGHACVIGPHREG